MAESNHGCQANSINLAAERFTQARHDFQAKLPIAVSAPAIITGEHTKVVREIAREFSDSLHGAAA